jgi:hypothetical protein
LKQWGKRCLTPTGRITDVKPFVLQMLCQYLTHLLRIVKKIAKLFFSLVVGLSSHKGKKEVQVKRREYGGLKMEKKEICYTCIQIVLGKISYLFI